MRVNRQGIQTSRALAAAGVLAISLLWVPDTGAASRAVVVDVQGNCPKDPRVTETQSPVCRRTKFGNAVSAIFNIPGTRNVPDGPWGLTWAYHCARRGDFYLVVHLPAIDGLMPGTYVDRTGHTGRGYRMETNRWQASFEAAMPQWRSPQNLVLNTTCTFHARVVFGDRGVVARNVPAIPKLLHHTT